jgi:stage II sporulation protein AA (anti-sigma F factor antagonist)
MGADEGRLTAAKHTTGARLWRLHTKSTVEAGRAILTVEGRLDHAGAAQFEAAVAEYAPKGSPDATLDLSGVDYISSAGLKVIASLADRQTQAGGRLRLRAPSASARLALEFSGLAPLIEG